MHHSVKEGRINIETVYLVEKGALLFLSVNLIAASLGIDKLSWSENSGTEFVFGWNSWIQTDTSITGVTVIRDREYGSNDCALDSCDSSMQAGLLFFSMNMITLILLACCCIITLEMAVFHFTYSYKKVANAIMAILAFTFNLTGWCNWVANSKTSEISQANAGNSTVWASSFWYSVFACLFLFVYCILVLKQNVANFVDKKKDREDVRPLPAAIIPTARSGSSHDNKNITRLLESRILKSEKDPPPPTLPEIPRRLTGDTDEESVKVLPPPVPTLALKNLPPPLPPRTTKEHKTPVERFSGTGGGRKRGRSRGLPSVRTVSVVNEGGGKGSKDDSPDWETIR